MLNQTTTASVLQIPVTMIVPNPKQPRKRFKAEELENLTASVKEHGVIQPLIVCPAGGDGIHILIAGERRLRAARGASLETVPAVIRDVNPDDLGVVALIENVVRDDMSPVEEGDAYLELRKKGNSNSQIAKLVGVNDVRVGHCINCASVLRNLLKSTQGKIDVRFLLQRALWRRTPSYTLSTGVSSGRTRRSLVRG